MFIRRCVDDRGRTVAIVLGKRRVAVEVGVTHPIPRPPEYVLACQICSTRESSVYCRAHACWLCVDCIQAHELMEGIQPLDSMLSYGSITGNGLVHAHCEYTSRAAARALVG